MKFCRNPIKSILLFLLLSSSLLFGACSSSGQKSQVLLEKKTQNGIPYKVGQIDMIARGRTHYIATVMVPQKNLAISFSASLEEDLFSREKAYEEIEKMYSDIEFHLGEKDYVSGNTFLVGSNSEICFYPDKTFKFYRSKEDHENDYYEGTYDVFCGEEAINKVISLEGYAMTKEKFEPTFANRMKYGISHVLWKFSMK